MHGAIFLATWNASTKSGIALQVARKIAPCDRALHVCLAYLFLHSGQVLSSFKCYLKRKYLNLIDSNCDVDESCPCMVFYRDCPCHRPWMYYQYTGCIKKKGNRTLGDQNLTYRNHFYVVGKTRLLNQWQWTVPAILNRTRRLQRRSLRLPTRSKSAQTGHLCTTAQAGADPGIFVCRSKFPGLKVGT